MAPYHGLENQGLSKQSSRSGELLSVNKDSHTVGKPVGGGGPPFRRDWPPVGAALQAPTIRVIHIFAPKVIKTDVANFRSTVQKLTGRNKKSSSGPQRRGRTKTVSELAANPRISTISSTGASFTGLWDQESSQKEVLQRLVGDACGTEPVRCNSVESTYSIDNGNFSGDSNASNDTDLPSPTDSFSFYPHREAPYSLSEIPAPFFGGDIHPCYSVASPVLSHPTQGSLTPDPTIPLPSVMDNNISMLGFDVDISSGLGSPPAAVRYSFSPYRKFNRRQLV